MYYAPPGFEAYNEILAVCWNYLKRNLKLLCNLWQRSTRDVVLKKEVWQRTKKSSNFQIKKCG